MKKQKMLRSVRFDQSMSVSSTKRISMIKITYSHRFINIVPHSFINNKEKETQELHQQIEDLLYQVKKLKNEEKSNEGCLREHIESMKKLVEVKNQTIDKLDREVKLMKDEVTDSQAVSSDYLHRVKMEKDGNFIC